MNRQTAPSAKLARRLSWLVAVIITLLPFHAFLTVWFSSFLGHYTLLRLWKEFLLVIVVVGAAYLAAVDGNLRKKIFSLWLVRLIIIYIVLFLGWGVFTLAGHDVTSRAMWYGLLVDLRFLIFFLAVLVIVSKSRLLSQNWQKILFVPAIFVAAFAILQYLILPYDFLKHFGYGLSTINPYETINHNINHLRVASTLRGANPLGAYLILPICVLATVFFKRGVRKSDILMFGFGLLLALAFSFSRSAWIGAALGALVVVWLALRSWQAKKNMLGALVIFCIVLGFAAVALRSSTYFESIFLHTDRSSKIATTSNEQHVSAFKAAGRDIIHQPLGRGVGTAGPQSVYNTGHETRIAENYFLQIGQEAGVLGMVLFIAICVSVGKMLFERRNDLLALALLASLVGISFVNLLSHAWADDTLAYIWWGLAGVALSPAILKPRLKRNAQS